MKTLIALTLIIAAACGMYFGFYAYRLSNAYAYTLACDALKKKMPAPVAASAKFGGAKLAEIIPSPDGVMIASYVDAQNEFGVPARTPFIASVKKSRTFYRAEIISPK